MNTADRNAASLIAHDLIPGEQCLYCHTVVRPKISRNGATRHLDHFIPLSILSKARTHKPFSNWLIPCCPSCNNLANGYGFLTFTDKHDFLCGVKNLSDIAPEALAYIRIPDDMLTLFKPIEYLRLSDSIVSFLIRRSSKRDTVWRIDERAITCGPMIRFMDQSKTAF
jgi:hypothetical protein